MIAEWMLYCSLCALGLALAAVLAERALLVGRGPVRFVWVASIALSLVVPVVVFRLPSPRTVVEQSRIDTEIATGTTPSSPPSSATTVAPSSRPSPARNRPSWPDIVARANRPLGVAWIVLSSLLGLYFVGGMLALAWMRRRWERRSLAGVPVFVSQRTGPAVVGAIAPAIVVPEWVFTMNPEQLALMLQHEREHQRARDGQLLIVAQLAAVLMPWNIALWWQLVRLRVAIELDCDARVLKSTDARSYGNLLLEVARPRQGPRLLGVTAFAERATQLERRIRELARTRKGSARKARTTASTIGVAALSVAWISPHPTALAHTRPIVMPGASRADSLKTVLPAMPASDPVAPSTKDKHPITAIAKQAHTTSASTDRATVVELQHVRGPGDSVFSILFNGITLSAEHARDAHDLLDQLAIQQAAQDQQQASVTAARTLRASLLRVQRDSALRALLTSDADRATFDAHLAQPLGGRGRVGGRVDPITGAAGMPGGRGGADPVYVIDGVRISGDSLVLRAGVGVSRGRVGGGGGAVSSSAVGGGRAGGRGAGGTVWLNPSQAMLDSMATKLNALSSELTFHRLFDGISLTADQESAARSLIASTQNAIGAGGLGLERPVLKVNLVTGMVAMRPESTEALVALASTDSDRATVRSRIISMLNP